MESVFDQQSHVQSHHLVMCHHDDGDYLCQIRDSQAGGTVGAGGGTTVAPGIMALAPPGVPSSSPTPFKSASTTALVPADAGLYVLGGGAQAQVPTSESALARMFKGLAADAATDETEVVRLLQSLLATSETTKPPKLNPVEKVLGTDVRTLAARASIAYPVLRAAAADPALRAMLIAELVSLSLEDGGGVVLPMGLRTHPLPLERWREFKENLAGLSARNLP